MLHCQFHKRLVVSQASFQTEMINHTKESLWKYPAKSEDFSFFLCFLWLFVGTFSSSLERQPDVLQLLCNRGSFATV